VELLKERGVRVVDAMDLAAEDYSQVTFATVWKPKPGLLSQVLDPLYDNDARKQLRPSAAHACHLSISSSC
jgi:hypothetical protein